MTHAEEGAVLQLARQGIRGEGLIMVCPWAACVPCARDIINAGLSELIVHQEILDRTTEPRWLDDIVLAFAILEEAGVEVNRFAGTLGVSVLFNGNIEQV